MKPRGRRREAFAPGGLDVEADGDVSWGPHWDRVWAEAASQASMGIYL